MTRPNTRRGHALVVPQRRRDDGSVLPLVLILMVVGSLVVIPLLQYAVTVTRAGEVESDKARSVEYARAGLRTALVSTEALYDNCGLFAGDSPRTVASVDLPGVTTTCRVVATANYLDSSEVPYHLATVQIDQPIPPEFAGPFNYNNPSAAPDTEDAWHVDRSVEREALKVWVPNLPVRPDSDRTTPAQGDDDYSRPMSFGTCDVYFPGTYREPVAVGGPRPVYFVSGIYYFESSITFEDGADAVIGDGETEGCTSDIDALNYVSNPPDSTLISGVGATFVFGGDGRLIVDNSSGPVSVVFNQRYADESEEGALPSDGVSIMTVNGDLDDANPTGDVLPLFVDDVLATFPANVTVAGEIVNVAGDGYVPSVHTPEPLPPDQPAPPTATAYRTASCNSLSSCADKGAAFLTWSAPNDSGFVITEYFVEQRERTSGAWGSWEPAVCPMALATQPGAPVRTSCTVEGLQANNGGFGYQFRVIAMNLGGQSNPSGESNEVRPDARGGNAHPQLAVPAAFRVANNLGSGSTDYLNGKLISWAAPAAPANTGGLPVLGYRVTATPTGPNPAGHPVVECTSTWESLECLLPADDGATAPVDGLVRNQSYAIDVRAANSLGESVPGTPPRSLTFLNGLNDAQVANLPLYEPPPPPPTPAILRVPDPIIDVRSASADPIEFRVAGYVSIPQGRIALDGGGSPTAHRVGIVGGAVAARIDVANLAPGFEVGLDNPTTQKTIVLTTTVDGDYDARAEAVLQVNANFGWALNSWEAS